MTQLVSLGNTGKIEYKLGNNLDIDDVIELYVASTLAERRPADDKDRMLLMIQNSNIIITAWDKDVLVGIARSLSDKTYVTYLADLAVRVSHQKQHIGKELMVRTRKEIGNKAMLVLLAAPKAAEYYPHVGFSKLDSAWSLKPGEEIK